MFCEIILPLQGAYRCFLLLPQGVALGWAINGFQPFARRKFLVVESFIAFFVLVF